MKRYVLPFSLPDPLPMGAPMPLTTRPDVLDFLATRRSASALTLVEPGPSAEDLDVLTRLACRAPDHGKLTPWRMIVLETQSCNEAAIAFYRKNGFSVIGFDLYAYSNTDPERHEVRIEMGKKLHGPSVR